MLKRILKFVAIILLFTNCKPKEEQETFWNDINTKSEYQPFLFVFSNTQVPSCAEYAQPQLEKILNGEIKDIVSKNINGFMMYPSILDPQYSNIAEELKFIFDQNGNNTLTSWPAYINDLICFNLDSNSWHTSIKNSQSKTPSIKLGVKSTIVNEEVKIYLKGEYTKSVSNHSIAVYTYRKSELTNQKTYSGTEIITLKNKIISSLTPTVGKSLDNNSSGQEFQEIFTLNTTGETLSNLGIVAVIYGLDNQTPKEVINSIKLEDFQ